MEPGFFSSREFVIAATVAVLAVGVGAALAFGDAFLGVDVFSHPGCEEPDIAGTALSSPAVQVQDSGSQRFMRYAFDPAGLEGGAVAACAVFGDAAVGPSPDALVHVTFTIRTDGPRVQEALDRTEVRVAFREAASGLGVLAWVEQEGQVSSFGSHRVASVDVEVLVPTTGAYDARVETGFGLASVDGILTREVFAESDLGDVRVSDVDAQGNLTATTSHGEVDVSLAGVRNATLRLTSSLGDVSVRLPQRADVGYEVTAASDLSEVDVAVGPVEVYETESESIGERVHVRTVGYADKPTQVTVLAESSHGDVSVTAGASA